MTTGSDLFRDGWDHDKSPVVHHEDGSYTCGRPDTPWSCSREPGHKGPCTATRDERVSLRPVMADIKTFSDYQPAFYLCKEQSEAIRTWMKEHDETRHAASFKHGQRYSGAIGGAYTFCFTPTSLGTVAKVECSCGERFDVTDYDW